MFFATILEPMAYYWIDVVAFRRKPVVPTAGVTLGFVEGFSAVRRTLSRVLGRSPAGRLRQLGVEIESKDARLLMEHFNKDLPRLNAHGAILRMRRIRSRVFLKAEESGQYFKLRLFACPRPPEASVGSLHLGSGAASFMFETERRLRRAGRSKGFRDDRRLTEEQLRRLGLDPGPLQRKGARWFCLREEEW